MANIKISEMAESDVLVGDEILPIVQDGITKKVSVTQIVDKVDSYTKGESDDLLDTKVSISDVKDDLISEDINKPLSANQGKVLQDTKVDKVTGSSLVEDTKVTSYDNHLANTSNPHSVTASQVDAYSTSQSDTLLLAKEDKTNKGVANGYAQLDSNAKLPNSIIPDSVLGQLEYQGVYDFSTGLPTATEKGQYWICSVAGNGYEVGDWAVYNGTTFDKVDNTDAVSSVAGRTGNVVLTKDDVGLNNVTNEAQEVLTNKKTDMESNKTSNTFFPSIKAVYDWAKGLFVSKVTSTDNAIVRFNGTTGEVQNSGVLIDDSNSVGIGVPLSAWNSSYKAIEFIGGAIASAFSSTLFTSANAIRTTTGWNYINTNLASLYMQNNGTHAWQTAPSGTAGNPITWTNAMTLGTNGNLLVGTTTDNGVDKLQVNGSIKAKDYQLEQEQLHLVSGTTITTQVTTYTYGIITLFYNLGNASLESIRFVYQNRGTPSILQEQSTILLGTSKFVSASISGNTITFTFDGTQDIWMQVKKEIISN